MDSDDDGATTAAALIIILESRKRNIAKKKRVWVKDWLLEYGNKSHYETIYSHWVLSDPEMYRRCLRLSTQAFEDLLYMVRPLIQRSDTNMRKCIPADKRLALTLRYLATGEAFLSLSIAFCIGETTAGLIIPELCDAIYTVLENQVRRPASEDEWKAVAQHNFDRWDYPNCIGALDGKHVLIDPPPNSGSEFHNYKGTFSVVLIALVDGDIRAIYADAGKNGRVSDGGVWASSDLKKKMDANEMNIPPPAAIPQAPDVIIPYHIVADDAFGLTTSLMKPYSAVELRGNMPRRIFNYRLSRCRNRVENYFGVLANRFLMYRSPLRVDPEKATRIILCTVALHNWLRTKAINREMYTPSDYIDWEDVVGGTNRPGQWRNEVQPAGIVPFVHQGGNRTALAVRNMRDQLCHFVNGVGTRDWQERMIL